MDRVNHRAVMKAKEDRISNLPDDIIHHIMSFLDIKDSIRTSKLSRKWRNIWTSMPHLKFNSCRFRMWANFAKFVRQVLSHRNNHAQVSTVALTYTWAAKNSAVEDIVRYAYSHNVQKLKLVWLSEKTSGLPQFIFSSHTLKHLTLVYSNNHSDSGSYPCLPESDWDFPALETLILRNIRMGYGGDKNLNLFSKCLNLKDITLEGYFSNSLEVFNICAPQLSNLTIANPSFAKVFNVVAPQLENLKLSVYATSCFNFSKDSFISLETVYITLSSAYQTKKYAPVLLDLLQQLRSVKFLIIDVDCIEPTPLHRTTTGDRCLCPSDPNQHLLPPRIQLPYVPARGAPSPMGGPFVRIPNIHLTSGVRSSFRQPVQQQLPLPSGPQKRTRCPIHDDGAPANKAAKLEEEEKRVVGANFQNHKCLSALRS